MVDSPHHPETDVIFALGEAGVVDPDEEGKRKRKLQPKKTPLTLLILKTPLTLLILKTPLTLNQIPSKCLHVAEMSHFRDILFYA